MISVLEIFNTSVYTIQYKTEITFLIMHRLTLKRNPNFHLSHIFKKKMKGSPLIGFCFYAEIYPAKIFGPSSVTEGVNINFKCSTTGIRGPEDKFNFYLCKNGVGIRIALLEKGEDDAIFDMKNVTREDSGNYSCVYTRDKLVPSHLRSTGDNLVVFQVDGEQKSKILSILCL